MLYRSNNKYLYGSLCNASFKKKLYNMNIYKRKKIQCSFLEELIFHFKQLKIHRMY